MQLKTVALLLGAIAQVIAQTPPNTLPATNKTVAVTYGSIKVTAGIQLTTRGTFYYDLFKNF